MPLYEYQCGACGHRFEVIRKFADAPLEMCPKCGGAVQKLVSAPAFHLKGSGWYITDYARKDQGAQDDSSGSGAKSPAKDAGAKTDGANATADSGNDSGKKSDKKSDKNQTPPASGTATGTSSSSKDAS